MGLRRGYAHALAAVAVALFVLGLVYAVSPPEPDCGEGIAVYCQQEAYDRIRYTILGSWIGGIVLLGVAAWILFYVRKNPAPEREPRKRRAAAVPERTLDGRRVVSASRPPPLSGGAPVKTSNGRLPAADAAPRSDLRGDTAIRRTEPAPRPGQGREELENENV